jgi:hypothetical protein
MTLIGQPLNEQPRLDREAYLKSWFSEQAETNVKIAALGYLGAWGITADLPYVRAELDRGDYQTRSAATDAFFSIILRDSRERALEALIELQVDSLSKSVLDELFSIPSSLELASLLKAIEHRNSSVRRAAAKILRERSALPTENSEQLMTDTSADVRMEALLALKTDGRQFSDAEAKAILVKPSNQGLLGWSDGAGEANYKWLRESQLRQLSEQELNTLIDKHFPLDEAEYMARAETYYEKYGHELKAALEDEFAAHFKASMQRFAEAVSNDTIEQLGDFLRKSLTRSGLSVIERRQNAEDIGLVRKVLGSGFVTWSDSDADYLARFGEWQDIKILSEMVEKPDYGSSTLLGFSDNGRYRAAARAINKLSKNRWRELLASPLKDRLTETVIVEIPDKVFRELDYNSLKPLLFSENAWVRKVGVLKAIKSLNRARIKELFSHYISSEGQRHYNVIHGLDFGVSVPRDRVSLAASRTLARMACRGRGLGL